MRPHRTIPERFWSKVNKHSGHFWHGIECWDWTGGRMSNGYGSFSLRAGHNTTAHRFVYEVRHGPVPAGLSVLHHCDRRVCVRDEHHFLGTAGDNVRDCIAKGRHTPPPHPQGERHHRAKLTDETVRELRRRYRAGGVTATQLAAEFGIHKATAARAISGVRWSHVE